MPEHPALRQAREAMRAIRLHQCYDCPAPAADGMIRCLDCNAAKNEAHAALSAKKRARGECKDCPMPSGGYVRCQECRRKHAEARQAREFERSGHVKPRRPGSNLVRGLRS